MSDEQTVDQAYDLTLQHLFSALFQAYTLAKTSAERDQANQRFQTGVKLAREARAQAKQLIR